jgi:hypothetical protein
MGIRSAIAVESPVTSWKTSPPARRRRQLGAGIRSERGRSARCTARSGGWLVSHLQVRSGDAELKSISRAPVEHPAHMTVCEVVLVDVGQPLPHVAPVKSRERIPGRTEGGNAG